MRIGYDLFTFYTESDIFNNYVENQLLTDVSQINTFTRVLIYMVGTIDLIGDRIIVSGSLLLVFFVYVFTNLVSAYYMHTLIMDIR